MPLKATGTASLDDVHRWEGGTTWIAHPEESMERASHVLNVDGDLWVVDPVDCAGLDEHLADLGAVTGVVLLLDRHKRDAASIARRHGVAVHVPEWMDGMTSDIDAPVKRFGTTLGPYRVYPLVRSRFWQEAALYDEDAGTLVVPESVGTGSIFLAGEERLGVHPVMRLRPPRRLRQFDSDRVLLGHGPPVTEDPATALRDALNGSRRRAPALYFDSLRRVLFG